MDLAALDTHLDLGACAAAPRGWANIAPQSPPKPVKQPRKPRPCKKALRRAARSAAAAAAAASGAAPAGRRARDPSVPCLEQEVEEGNVEYKLMLSDPNPLRYQQLITQMKYRLDEGRGEAFYYIGVQDDGYPRGLDPERLASSLDTLRRMAAALGARATLVERLRGGFGLSAALVQVQRNTVEEVACTDVRVAVAGGTDSGKSTLSAVLAHGADGRPALDDGRGRARVAVLRHKHEISSGRTSSIGHALLGYDTGGRVLNYSGVSAPAPSEVLSSASRAVALIDLGGHRAFLRTALFGMTSTMPDYALLCVCPSSGVTATAREHLAVAVALGVPAAVVITKSDTAGPERMAQMLAEVGELAADLEAAASDMEAAASHMEAAASDTEAAASDGGGAARMEGSRGSCGGGCGSGRGAAAFVVSSAEEAAAAAEDMSALRSGGGSGGGGGGSPGAAAAALPRRRLHVFVASSVTGAGLQLLHTFLSHLRPDRAPAGAPPPAPGAACAARELGGMRPGGRLLLGGVADRGHGGGGGGSDPGLDSISDSGSEAGDCKDAPWSVGGGAGPARADTLRPQAAAAGAVREAAAVATAPPSGHFQVFHTFDLEGLAVACGICVEGTISLGQLLLWGPSPSGGFSPVVVAGIHRGQVPVQAVRPGQAATLALEAPLRCAPGPGEEEQRDGEQQQRAEHAAAAAAAGRCREQMRRQSLQRKAEAAAMAAAFGAGAAANEAGGGASGGGDSGGDGGGGCGGDGGDGGGGNIFGALDAAAAALADCLSNGSSDAGGTERGGTERGGTERGGADPGDCFHFDQLQLGPDTSDHSRTSSMSSSGGSSGGGLRLRAAGAGSGSCSSASASGYAPGPAAARRQGWALSAPEATPEAELGSSCGSASSGGLFGGSPGPSHKGSVLLCGAATPRAHHEFEASLMLLPGPWLPEDRHWPGGEPLQGAVEGVDGGGSQGGGGCCGGIVRCKGGRRGGELCFVVHCNGIRQVAKVVHIQEMNPAGGAPGGLPRPLLPGGIAMAAALLQRARGGHAPGRAAAGEAAAPARPFAPAVVASVRFRFVHRPEWMKVGARVILRDRADGCVAAAGCIAALLP